MAFDQVVRRGRRRFLQVSLALTGIGLLSGCRIAPLRRQESGRTPRIGYLAPNTAVDPISTQQQLSLRQGLSELGYTEGRDFVLETRSADFKPERIPNLIAELVAVPVDVIVSQNSEVVAAAKRATTTVPVVFAGTPDPVGQGLVSSLARPGGKLTGLALNPSQFSGKQLQLLKETAPSLSRVAIVLNPNNSGAALGLGDMQAAATTLRLESQPLEVRTADDFSVVLQAARQWQANGLVVINDALISAHLTDILEFADRDRLPGMYSFTDYVVAGGLMAYAASLADLWRRAASYVDKILKGATPAELPVELPTKFDFVINLKTARAIGLAIPPSVLRQATEIIQ